MRSKIHEYIITGKMRSSNRHIKQFGLLQFLWMLQRIFTLKILTDNFITVLLSFFVDRIAYSMSWQLSFYVTSRHLSAMLRSQRVIKNVFAKEK